MDATEADVRQLAVCERCHQRHIEYQLIVPMVKRAYGCELSTTHDFWVCSECYHYLRDLEENPNAPEPPDPLTPMQRFVKAVCRRWVKAGGPYKKLTNADYRTLKAPAAWKDTRSRE